MKTLKELNEKVWYRLIKVLYGLLYIPSLLVLFVAYDSGKDYHQPVYPNTIIEVLNDPEFYKVSDYDKRNALSEIDKDFKNLNYSEQTHFLDEIKKYDIKTKEFTKARIEGDDYVYHSWLQEILEYLVSQVPELKSYTVTSIRSTYSDLSDRELVDTLHSKYIGKHPAYKYGFSEIDSKYEGMISKNNWTKVFTVVKRTNPFTPKGDVGKYHYASYYTRNIGRTILNSLIATLCYILFMEIIRRAFYYVAIGKLFPKE